MRSKAGIQDSDRDREREIRGKSSNMDNTSLTSSYPTPYFTYSMLS